MDAHRLPYPSLRPPMPLAFLPVLLSHLFGGFPAPQNTHFIDRQWQALIGASDQYEGVKRGRSQRSSHILRLLWVAFPQVFLLTALASTRGRLLSLIRQVTNEPAAAYTGFTFKNGLGHLSGCQHERFPPRTIGIKALWSNPPRFNSVLTPCID